MLVPCPTCRKQCRVPDRALGKPIKCHGCGTTFRAGEEEAEPIKGQTSPKKPFPSPPAAVKVREEKVAPRRPVAEEPRRATNADEDDDEIPLPKPPSSRSQAHAAALWFLLAGIATIIIVVVLLIGFFVLTKGNRNVTGAHAIGFFFRELLIANGALWHFLAFASLKSFEGKRNVIVALVIGYILALLLGVEAAGLAFGEYSPGGTLVGVIAALGGITALLNLIAAILGTVILSQRKVTRRFH